MAKRRVDNHGRLQCSLCKKFKHRGEYAYKDKESNIRQSACRICHNERVRIGRSKSAGMQRQAKKERDMQLSELVKIHQNSLICAQWVGRYG